MCLQIISEPLDIFHRDQFLDPVGPSFKFDRHARETVGWRRRDPPEKSLLVDDERDGFACRQRCASISLCFLVCHHGSPLPCGPLCEGLHHIHDGAPSPLLRPCPGCADNPGPQPAPEGCRPRRWLGTLTSGVSSLQGPPDTYTLDQATGQPHVCACLSSSVRASVREARCLASWEAFFATPGWYGDGSLAGPFRDPARERRAFRRRAPRSDEVWPLRPSAHGRLTRHAADQP